MIYINGEKATRAQLLELWERGKRGEITLRAITELNNGDPITVIKAEEAKKD